MGDTMKSQFYKTALVVLVGLGIAIASTTTATAQDLFKKDGGGLSDAFSGKNDNRKSSSDGAGYGFAEMEKFVLANEFKDTKKITDRAYRFTYEYKEWTLPTILEISKSKTNIWVTMILKYPKVDIMEYPDRLMKLLEWNGTYGDSFFSIIPSSKAITLVAALQLNGPVSDKDIKKQLEYVGGLALRTQDLWDTSKWADAPQHVGSWKGEESNKMSLSLTRDGRFELTSSSGTKTKGKYTIAEGSITMTESTAKSSEGEKISGKIEFTDANHFVLEVNGAKLKFVRN